MKKISPTTKITFENYPATKKFTSIKLNTKTKNSLKNKYMIKVVEKKNDEEKTSNDYQNNFKNIIKKPFKIVFCRKKYFSYYFFYKIIFSN